MKKRIISFLLILLLTFTLLPAAVFAASPAVDTDQASYTAGNTVNVLLSSSSDLMIEVFRGDAATGTKLISSATSNKAYSFKTGTDWAAGTYTVVVGAGSNMASCTFKLSASSGGSPSAQYVYLSVYGPDSVLLSGKQISYVNGMSAYTILKNYSGLSVASSWSNSYGGYYVSSVSGYSELDYGSMSGWMYSVNGTVPNVSASSYTLSAGDNVLWFYTKNGYSAMYSQPSSDTSAQQTTFTADDTGTAFFARDKLSAIAQIGKGFSVNAAEGDISLSPEGTRALSEKLGLNEELKVEVAKTDASASKFAVVSSSKTIAALDVSITAGSTEIKSGFGSMTISIKVGAAYKNRNLSILHLKEDGSHELLTGSVDAGGVLSFSTASLSTFVVMLASDIPVEYRFADIKAGEWYTKYVQYVYGNGLMTGSSDTTFAPSASLSRAMLVTVLYRMAGSPSSTAKSSFKDVKDSSKWYYNAVAWASENGIINGYGDESFGIDDNITREQMAAIFYRYAKYKGYDVSAGDDINILSYDDSLQISEWAYPALQWAIGEGIITGTSSDRLSPAGTATRCEAAAVITRFKENIKS